MSKLTNKLTAKEELFAQKVVELDSQSEALRIAYPHTRNWKPESIWSRASTLASSSKVSKRINEIKQQLSKKEIITKEEIVKDLVGILKSDITDYIEVVDDEDQYIIIKDLNGLSKEQRRRIKSMKPTRNGIEIELYPITDILDRLTKMLGLNEAEKTSLEVTSKLTDKELEEQINNLRENLNE